MEDAREKLQSRLNESFTSIYLTLISILQSILLGLLATLVMNQINSEGNSIANLTLEGWLKIISSVLVIIITWNEYRMAVQQFHWYPRIADTLIPFSISISEFLLINSIFGSSNLWFYSFAVLCITTTFGYLNMYYRARQFKSNIKIIKAIGKGKYIDIVFPIILSAIAISFASLNQDYEASMISILLCLLLLFIIHSEIQWLKIIKFAGQDEE